MRSRSIPAGYKPWLVLSIAVLVGALMLLAADLVAAFYYFGATASPIWVTVLGVVAGLGIVTGFAGFFLMMVIAGWTSFREGRLVQVIPPVHVSKE